MCSGNFKMKTCNSYGTLTKSYGFCACLLYAKCANLIRRGLNFKASKGSVSSDEICINGCSQYTYNGVQSDLGIL